ANPSQQRFLKFSLAHALPFLDCFEAPRFSSDFLLIMRLLKRNKNDDGYYLTEFITDIPNYAILSHTWGADNEEVTLKDLSQGTFSQREGYKKSSFAGTKLLKTVSIIFG
ncbi:hypothetical protein GQ44DRAFT_811139, partial [Phaeosphaeriaceae sp. PMI808]